MPGGRPRKRASASTGKIGKEAKLQREIAESKLSIDRTRLLASADTLDFFNEESKQEYIRVINEAAAIEILDNLDQAYIKLYSDAWAMYNAAVNVMSEEGLVIEIPNADGSTKKVKNPALDSYNSAVKTINQCSTKLGLATTDRLKLIVPTKDEKPVNKFVKFIK